MSMMLSMVCIYVSVWEFVPLVAPVLLSGLGVAVPVVCDACRILGEWVS